MTTPPTFDRWEELLDLVEERKVIPIVGEGIVTFGEDGQPLYPALATELAKRLGVDPARLPAMPSLASVLNEHERNELLEPGTPSINPHARLKKILEEVQFPPGPALLALAEIEAFQLYLTTVIDPLLQRAVDSARHDGRQGTDVVAYSSTTAKDIATKIDDLPRPTVYHLFGRASSSPDFVVREVDLLDFLYFLPRDIERGLLRNLSVELATKSLLSIGLGFSDWTSRLLLRIARQKSLTDVKLSSWLAEGPPGTVSRSMVMFFGGVNKKTQVVECHPSDFALELARRWRQRKPRKVVPYGGVGEAGLVFLSYAREDQAAALRIKAGLEAQGCTVFFDRERLGTGSNFENRLQDQVGKQCALFVSVISPTTESATGDNYFRRERNWAVQRAGGYSDEEREEFYLPFLIHENLPPKLIHEPRIFAAAQWNHCPRGEVALATARRVAELQKKHCVHRP